MKLIGVAMVDEAQKDTKISTKQFAIKGEKKPPFKAIERFLDALNTNHVIKAKVFLDSFPELATLRGNFFPLPLLIAGMHGNIDLMSELLDKGACPHLAKKQSTFDALPQSSKHFIDKICQFRKEVLEKLQGLH